MSYSHFNEFLQKPKAGEKNHLEQDLKLVKEVLFHFFYVLGAIHISSSILAAKYPQEKFFYALSNIFDLPFFIVMLAFACFKLCFILYENAIPLEKSLKIALGLLSAGSIVLLGVNFLIPDLPLP